MRRLVLPALLAALAPALGGCVSPAPTLSAYEPKAAMTAESALSSVGTALLSEDAYVRGRLPAAYLETVLVDAEGALGSVRTTFDSVQPPPTTAADALRNELDPLLEEAGSGITELRIAARRDRRPDLLAAADRLSGAAEKLRAFSQEHAP